MTLKLHKVSADVERLRKNAVDRAAAHAKALPEIRRAFDRAALQEDLYERAHRAAERGWDGALPTGSETLAFRKPAPPAPEPFTLVAVDGSQVYPDRHAAAQFYAINIGHFLHRSGRHETDSDSEPRIVFEEDALYLEGNLISQVILNARRTADEMTSLQRLASRERAADPKCPVLALLDGGLALRIDEKAFPAAEREALQHRYFDALDQLAAGGIAVAGYISRPGGAPVLSLLALALDPAMDADSSKARIRSLFGDVHDAALFEDILGAGERSAVFEFAAYWNTLFRHHDPNQSVHFFYVNVGRRYPVVARVEIPQWTAARPELVDRLHAALVEQCAVTLNDPYPYALIRADEEAFISASEKAYLEEQTAIALIRSGLRVARSEKLSHKGRARKR